MNGEKEDANLGSINLQVSPAHETRYCGSSPHTAPHTPTPTYTLRLLSPHYTTGATKHAPCLHSSLDRTPDTRCRRTQYRTQRHHRDTYIAQASKVLQYGTVQYSTVQYSVVQYSAVQCSAVQCSTVQCSTAQYSTAQYSTVQCNSVVQHRRQDS
jgi:hypothetical protein